MYFEIDDIKHRHSPYYDITNVRGWVDTPEDYYLWHWARGGVAGVLGSVASVAFAHRWEAYKTLRTHYHSPETFQQVYDYTKAIKKFGNFDKVRSKDDQTALRLGRFRRFYGLGKPVCPV
jgi:uncharacterized protein (DUF3820 family)